MNLLKPLASECNPKAQILLAQVYGETAEPFKAYMWYRAAEMTDGTDVSTELEREAETLQPAETEQATRAAERNIVRKCKS